MTKEEKKLVLKDLCGRLSYGVIVNTPKGDGHLCSINQTIFGNEYGVNIKVTERDFFNDDECDIKPYLRPMSDMTKDEKKMFRRFGEFEVTLDFEMEYIIEVLDMFNRNHLDYRGLIEKGLAMQAQKGMYNVK